MCFPQGGFLRERNSYYTGITHIYLYQVFIIVQGVLQYNFINVYDVNLCTLFKCQHFVLLCHLMQKIDLQSRKHKKIYIKTSIRLSHIRNHFFYQVFVQWIWLHLDSKVLLRAKTQGIFRNRRVYECSHFVCPYWIFKISEGFLLLHTFEPKRICFRVVSLEREYSLCLFSHTLETASNHRNAVVSAVTFSLK